MRVKIEDVARRAGVSTATVSLALNGNERINAKTRKRIVAIAREMEYHPNPYAQRLATRKSRQIGLVIPDIENVYYASLAQYTLNELLASDYGLTISTSMNSRETERRVIADMIANRVEGLLIAPVEKPNEDIGYLDMLREAGIPYIFVTASYHHLDDPCIMCDLYTGMSRLLEALYAQGYRRMALLSGTPNVFCIDLRDRAYLDFAQKYGAGFSRVHHVNSLRYDDSYRFVRRMEETDVDAIVCVNDMMALGAINALRERGLRVPRDIAVAGFDDSIFCRVSPIALTSVRQDVQQIAVRASESILDLAQSGALKPENLELIPCEVVLRQSTELRNLK